MKENGSERKVVYLLYQKCLCMYDMDLNAGTLGSWETEINNKDNIKIHVCLCVFYLHGAYLQVEGTVKHIKILSVNMQY